MADEAKASAAKDKKAKTKVPSAKKRELQSKKRQEWNSSFAASVRTAIRHFEMSLSKGDKSESMKRLNAVYSLMDKGVKTSRFKINKAARTKSRLASRLSA